MQMEEWQTGDWLVVTLLEARLDAAVASAFRESILARIDQASAQVVLDLHHVSFLDSSGLGALVFALKHVAQHGGRLHFCGVTPAVMAVLRLTRMDRVLKTFDSREAAIAA